MRQSSSLLPWPFTSEALTSVVGLEEAFSLFSPALGTGLASTLFAVAFLGVRPELDHHGHASGTDRDGGFYQVQMAGLGKAPGGGGVPLSCSHLPVGYYGSEGVTKLLIFSQVVLCLQLPFAVFPLVRITNSRDAMGRVANQLGLNWRQLGDICFATHSQCNAGNGGPPMITRKLCAGSE